jgi:hypothetical protein
MLKELQEGAVVHDVVHEVMQLHHQLQGHLGQGRRRARMVCEGSCLYAWCDVLACRKGYYKPTPWLMDHNTSAVQCCFSGQLPILA